MSANSNESPPPIDRQSVKHTIFGFFVRKRPVKRNFRLAAAPGLVFDNLGGLNFIPERTDWLGASWRFRRQFVDSSAVLHLAGDA